MALGPHAAPSRPCSKMDDNVPDHDRAPSPGRGEISAFQGILEQEAVTAAFSKSDFIGLRSLPSNLGPAFRETARDRRRARIRQQLTSMSLSSVGSAGGSLTSPGAPRALHSTAPMGWAGRGQEVPTRFDPAPVHVFTRYMHLPGEYAERVDLARKSHPSRWTAPQNFVVRSTKPPPRYKMEFRDFPHMADPYSAQEEGEKSEAEISGMLQVGGVLFNRPFDSGARLSAPFPSSVIPWLC